jgi:hypothetical protein
MTKSIPARCSARPARRPVGPAPTMRTLKVDISIVNGVELEEETNVESA